MFWSYDRPAYNDCRPCIVLSVLLPLTHFTAVYSVKTKTKANLTRRHFYRHRCSHRCKPWLMHEIEALKLIVNHTTVYAHIVISCDGPKIRMCTKSDNTAMTTDLMVISYYKC